MQTLSETSFAKALENPAAASRSLAFATAFTERHQALEEAPAPIRELELLRLQTPVVFQPIREGDLFAGRVLYPIVGVSPEPCGLGFYLGRQAVEDALQSGAIPAADSQKWRDILDYWNGRTTAEKTRAAFPPKVAERLPSDDWANASGITFPLYRMAGTTLDFPDLLARGIGGLTARIQRRIQSGGDRDRFLEACLGALDLLRETIDSHAASARDPAIRASLEAVRDDPPTTFRQAIQLLWIYALLSGTWCYGRLDRTLGGFLDGDLRAGRLDEDEALDLLMGFWRLIHAYDNQYNNRVIIGGVGRPDEAAADRFALLAIEATRRLRLNQPQLTLRLHSSQNPALWQRAVEAIGEGCTYPMLYNDEVNVPAVASAFGVDEATAREYIPFGCGEYTLGPGSMGSPNGVINLLKALEVVLHEGTDPMTGRHIPGLPARSSLTDFESLWSAYTSLMEAEIAAIASAQRIEYDVTGRDVPLLLISMLTPDCIDRARGLCQGGARWLGATLETYGNTNTADSLTVINELVYNQQSVTLDELVAALDADFHGHPELHANCRAVAKYGNDEALADAMARRVHDHVCLSTREQAAPAGLDSHLVVVINNWANTLLGQFTLASADGRNAGKPLANANNPSPGSDTAGVTAMLNSLTRLDPAIHAGSVQNMKFSREWFSASLQPKFEALLRTYFDNGGTQAMITVVSPDDLRAAMEEPEKWGHLMVRVGGFSIRFVDLPREAQLEILERTLH